MSLAEEEEDQKTSFAESIAIQLGITLSTHYSITVFEVATESHGIVFIVFIVFICVFVVWREMVP